MFSLVKYFSSLGSITLGQVIMVFVGYVFHSINKFKYKDNVCFVPIAMDAMAMKLIQFMKLVAISRTLKDETIRS